MEFDEATENIVESLRHTENIFVTKFESDMAMRFEMECRFMEYGQRNVLVKYLYELLINDGKKSTRNHIPREMYGRVITKLLIDKNKKIEM